MQKDLEETAGRYAIAAVITSIAFIPLTLLVIGLVSNRHDMADTLVKLGFAFPLPSVAGIVVSLFSAWYFGRQAGTTLSSATAGDSSIGLTTGLKILLTGVVVSSLVWVGQVCWGNEFHVEPAIFYFLRISVALFLLGLPITVIAGYSFGQLLINQIRKQKKNNQT